MFHVLDHADVVYSGDLSQSTQYVIEHYGKKLDEAIRSGIQILYTDALHSMNEVRKIKPGNSSQAEIKKAPGDFTIDKAEQT